MARFKVNDLITNDSETLWITEYNELVYLWPIRKKEFMESLANQLE